MSQAEALKRYHEEAGNWDKGNDREALFVEFMAENGFKVEPWGFLVGRNDYVPATSAEPGRSDFRCDIFGRMIYFDVTGTEIMAPDADLWVSTFKVDYVRTRNFMGAVCHIVSQTGLMRFIDMKHIDRRFVKVVELAPGITNTMCIVKPYLAMMPDEFKNEYLMGGK